MIETMIPAQVGMRLWEEREKREGAMLLSFYHTCASKQHHDLHDRESPMISLSYTSGNFSLQNLACIFLRWAFSNALGLREQANWMHTHQYSFVELSFIYSSSASVALQSLLLMLTSIDGHIHSPLIILVNVRLSPFLSSPHNPIIIFYSTHSAISTAHAHVLREG